MPKRAPQPRAPFVRLGDPQTDDCVNPDNSRSGEFGRDRGCCASRLGVPRLATRRRVTVNVTVRRLTSASL
jgi:hypothetical protein